MRSGGLSCLFALAALVGGLSLIYWALGRRRRQAGAAGFGVYSHICGNSACRHVNAPEARYCAQCGQALTISS